MAVEELRINIDVFAEAAIAQMKMLNTKLKVAEARMRLLNRAAKVGLQAPGINATNKELDKFVLNLTNAEQAHKKQAKAAEVANNKQKAQYETLNSVLMSLGFAFLFTGMMVYGAVMNMLSGLLMVYSEVNGEQSEIGDQLGALEAKTAALKYSLMAAFEETGALDMWLERANKILDWFDNLSDSSKSNIVDIGVWTALITLALTGIGAVFLFLLGPLALFKQAGVAAAAAVWISFLKVFAILLILGIAFIAIRDIIESEMNPVIKLLTIVGIVMAALTLVALIMGFSISLPFIIIIAVIGVVIATIALLSKEVGGIGNAFKAIGVFLLKILEIIAEGMIAYLLLPINLVIAAIRGVILLGQKLGKFQGITAPELINVDLDFGADGMRDELLAAGAESQEQTEATTPGQDDGIIGSALAQLGLPMGGNNTDTDITNIFNVDITSSEEYKAFLSDTEEFANGSATDN